MPEQRFDDPHHLAGAKVIVGVDGSDGSWSALRWAARFAAERGRELEILHGMDLMATSRVPGGYEVVISSVIDAIREQGRDVVARADRLARSVAPELRISAHATTDTGSQLLVERSAEAYAVVVGATGNAGTAVHLGSTLLAVTAHASGTVVVVRADPDAEVTVHASGPVVVGVDGSPVGEAAIAAAFTEASERAAALVAVHVWSDWASGRFAGHTTLSEDELDTVEQAILAERLAGWQEKFPEVRVSRKVEVSAPAPHLLSWSKIAQLIVVGSRGRGGFAGMLLGSTANTLVQHASCPVMVVHRRDPHERGGKPGESR
ncbi:universal stress protein [Nocardia gipuzkoensis]|uniref:universal stress protein n=1 Tax=Nocardia gipuzkoensis TaxID=2749991 RepID=UPI00237DBA69|nr:universal stress protein [Nocardia gipuzkoensis]MDE1673877.1 universal stress protein [Nocardia gipuzkoensis]